MKELFCDMDVLPTGDWPPSIGRHESKIALIEHGRGTLPGAKEAEEIQRLYIGGNVDRILDKKKEVRYEEIFRFENDKHKRKFKMLIDGAPGVGKTVLCRRFCKDWGAGNILQQFYIVWLLHLRDEEIAKAKSIEDLFQLDDKELQAEIVQHLKKTKGNGNLLICDGFDELSLKERTEHSLFLDIIRGKVLPQCSVIVTSRPYASLKLQLESFTHHVEVVGFTEKQIKKCIRRNIPDSVKAKELIDQLKQRLDILSLCYTPLNCAIILYVYRQSGDVLPTTLTQLYTLYILHTLKRSAEIHYTSLDSDTIDDLQHLPDPITLPFKALCEMAFDGLVEDQLGFDASQLPLSLQQCPVGKGTKPELLGLMSGSKAFSDMKKKLSYQFTHLTVQEYLAAWYAHTKLSAEEQSKLFQEKLNDQRFRMMLLFLAGITKLQDEQVHQHLFTKEELDIDFLAHLMYESQNAILCPILANAVQEDGELLLDFDDLFQCTVFTYFLSTCNYPWKLLKLRNLTDQQMQVMQQVSCEYAGRSDVRKKSLTPNDAHPLPFLEDTQEVRLHYEQSLPPSSPVCFSSLLNMKQLTELKVVILSQQNNDCDSADDSDSTITDKQLNTAWKMSFCNLFKALPHNTSLQKLDISSFDLPGNINLDDEEAVVALSDMMKTNTSLQCLTLYNLGLTDATATQIAAGLVVNHSLKTLNIKWNKITSVGAVSIFRALENNNTLETLDMRGNWLCPPLHSPPLSTGSSPIPPPPPTPSLPTPSTSQPSLLLSPSQLPIQTTPSVSPPEPLLPPFLPHSPSPTPRDGGVGKALAGMLSHNNTLTELTVSQCELTDATATHFAAGLAVNHSLKTLVISQNKITSVGAVSIFRALENNITLETLDMEGSNLLPPLHSPPLSTGSSPLPPPPPTPSLPTPSTSQPSLLSPSQLPIQTTPSFSTPEPLLSPFLLHSPSPTPHDGGVGTALAGMLSHTNTLTDLDVSLCDLTPQCCVSVFTALKHNSSLKKLYVRFNEFDQESSEALADMLSCNHSLTGLDISECDCQPKALARGLLHNTTLNIVTVDDDEKQRVMAALVELRAQDGHTQQPDPEVSRCDKVLRYVCLLFNVMN